MPKPSSKDATRRTSRASRPPAHHASEGYSAASNDDNCNIRPPKSAKKTPQTTKKKSGTPSSDGHRWPSIHWVGERAERALTLIEDHSELKDTLVGGEDGKVSRITQVEAFTRIARSIFKPDRSFLAMWDDAKGRKALIASTKQWFKRCKDNFHDTRKALSKTGGGILLAVTSEGDINGLTTDSGKKLARTEIEKCDHYWRLLGLFGANNPTFGKTEPANSA
ncbi:hypothetical protein JCM11641_006260 [Rhodosporidiobolus odoratus]